MQLVVLLFDNKQFTELEFMTDNDLETSEVPLSVLFCIIEKNAFLECKGSKSFSNNNVCIKNTIQLVFDTKPFVQCLLDVSIR